MRLPTSLRACLRTVTVPVLVAGSLSGLTAPDGRAATTAPTATAVVTAAGEQWAPLDRPGPALSVPTATLAAAVTCSGNFAGSDLQPVLLNPATGVTAAENFSWNYENVFRDQGRPWCTVTPPHHTLGDIQVAAEYIVFAIRHTRALAGRDIAVLGHSQGGMSMRWALRFWPDTRGMVDDIIGMAASNHGTTMLDSFPSCVHAGSCVPAVWQQRAGSQFGEALNSLTETFAGISYTEIYTRYDEVVTPPAVSSPVHGPGRITNVAVQEICPLNTSEHLAVGTTDFVTYSLVMDALDNDGPASTARVAQRALQVCLTPVMPGVRNPAQAPALLAGLPNVLLVPAPINVAGVPMTDAEPPLRCYVYATGCRASAPNQPAPPVAPPGRGAGAPPVTPDLARPPVATPAALPEPPTVVSSGLDARP